jgi:cell volume regulation protein A
MAGGSSFGLAVLVVGVAGLLAVLSNRIGAWSRIPVPALFLGAAALARFFVPALGGIRTADLEHIVTIALVLILFDGGMHIGWSRLRPVLGGVGLVGVVGTFLTAGAVALAAHGLFGFDWRTALLIGTALSPTDPAVVFSVLGAREISGPAGALLEAESGANDPVGIALLLALLAVHPGTPGFSVAGAFVSVLVTFAVQLLVGLAVGVAGGLALAALVRRFTLPSAALYPVRTLAAALAIYGLATVAHGSGFLAVLAAGVVMGDDRLPFSEQTRPFHSALAALAETVAFVLLGLSISLRSLPQDGALLIGLALGALLAFVIRPLLVGPLLLLVPGLATGERIFIAWAGLKGAVPILLGILATSDEIAGAAHLRVYDVIVVPVIFSVLVQGSTVPLVARWCRLPGGEAAE